MLKDDGQFACEGSKKGCPTSTVKCVYKCFDLCALFIQEVLYRMGISGPKTIIFNPPCAALCVCMQYFGVLVTGRDFTVMLTQ